MEICFVGAKATLRAFGAAVKLQRTFSMFPDGWAGLGLLLLRVAVASGLGWYSYLLLTGQGPTLATLVVATTSVSTGFALLFGYRTPFATTLGVITNLWEAFGWSLPFRQVLWEDKLNSAFVVIIAIALLCLGPGAFSLDALRYGRREIVIPQKPRSRLE